MSIMAKRARPSIIDAVMSPPAPVQEQAAETVPAKSGKERPDVQHTSVYLPRAAYERLREIAFAERLKIHDLLMEGMDLAIAKRGHPERATRSTKE
jgi:hypothetical protein